MQRERFPTWPVPLSAGTAVPHLVLSQMHFTLLTAREIIQGSQSHILFPEPFACYKASLWLTLLIHSITKHNSIDPPRCLVLSSSGV